METRKDPRGRTLNKGEYYRPIIKMYAYSYLDVLGKRRWVYSSTLRGLRELEEDLNRDTADGIDSYGSSHMTLNDLFNRYMGLKKNIRDTTGSNYQYMYDRFVRDTFGKKKVVDIRYSDVIQFYNLLVDKYNLKLSTIDNIHTLLHPAFDLAIRDDLIRKNPTEGAMAELRKAHADDAGVRKALTKKQQKSIMDYTKNHPVYFHYWPVFTTMLWTGMRVGECVGLRWSDVDLDKGLISVNHTIVQCTETKADGSRVFAMHVHRPKTKSGIRMVPILDPVREALKVQKEEEDEYGCNTSNIDGMRGFIFSNRFGQVPTGSTLNRAIKRIVASYNHEEELRAKKEGREPEYMPDFSCHIFRHTFATRICESTSNLKVIESIMGHSDIQTTMNIYADATQEENQETFDKINTQLRNIF